MRLFLDECVPRPLKRDLAVHDVQHVVDMGWSSKRNGELLERMVVERFDAMLTSTEISSFNRTFGHQALASSSRSRGRIV